MKRKAHAGKPDGGNRTKREKATVEDFQTNEELMRNRGRYIFASRGKKVCKDRPFHTNARNERLHRKLGVAASSP